MPENIELIAKLLNEATDVSVNVYPREQYVAKHLGCSVPQLRLRLSKLGYKWFKPSHSTDISHTMNAWKTGPCAICGEDREVDRAHIVPNSEMGASAEDNTVFLCPTHHRLFDKGKLSEAESAMLEKFFALNIGSTRAVNTSQRKRWIAKRY